MSGGRTGETLRRSLPLAALVALTVVRMAVAGALPLSPDEAYYWVWSRALAPGYLDHPPMVAAWVRAGTTLLGETPAGVRLLAPLSALAGTLMLVDGAGRMFGRRAGLAAGMLLNATLMFGVGAVTMTPDTPLLFFWTAAAWALARLAAGGGGGWWLVAGAAAGLAFDSKYTAVLLAVAAGGWLMLGGLRWARTPWPWAGAALGLAVTLPVLGWNAAHGWASFVRQGGRVAAWTPARAGQFVAELLGGQLGLATPWAAVLFVAGAWWAVRRWRDAGAGLCGLLVVPGAAVFIQHALGDRVQANWVAVLYPGCAMAAAGAGFRWRGAAVLGFGLTALLYVQATLAPAALPRGVDPALRLAGWPGLAVEAAEGGAAFLASDDYGVVSELAWAAPGVPVLAAGPRWALLDLASGRPDGRGILLVPARRTEPPDPATWDDAVLAGTLTRRRGETVIETFRAYRVGVRPGAASFRLPARRPG